MAPRFEKSFISGYDEKIKFTKLIDTSFFGNRIILALA